MTIVDNFYRFTPAGRTILTIGVFDGVHRGHQHLIRQVVQRARETAALSAVVTLFPHPQAVLAPHRPAPPLLYPLEERTRLIAALEVDRVAVLPFTLELSRLTALEFVRLVKRHVGLSELWVGADFALGHRREGTVSRLQEIGQVEGFTVIVTQPFLWQGEVVSSTRIRALLSQGDASGAADLLGRPYTSPASAC